MTAYEIMKARCELEDKMVELREKIIDAEEAMNSAYKIYHAAETDTDNFSDEEVEELYDIYEARYETFDDLEEQIEVLEHAIKVFNNMEGVIDELYNYKIWEG